MKFSEDIIIEFGPDVVLGKPLDETFSTDNVICEPDQKQVRNYLVLNKGQRFQNARIEDKSEMNVLNE